MTRVAENFSKFRITVLKTVNEEESKVLDSMAILRKQVKWLNEVHAGMVPRATSQSTMKLFKELKKIVEQIDKPQDSQRKCEFNLKRMYRQSKLVTDKLLDSAKVVFEDFKEKIRKMVAETREMVCIEELLTEKTYFRFLKDQKHQDVEILD